MITPHLDIWSQKYASPRPRRLLALTGGGIRGIMTLEILRVIERQLAAQTGAGDAFRLGDFFDFIAGTSTGAIIAAGLSLGMPVDELARFYEASGRAMFQKAWVGQRLWSKFQAGPLQQKIRAVLRDERSGQDRTLGARDLRCLLMVVARNENTDSAWPLTNNPFARYNDPALGEHSNLAIPLWQLVRASTAAPTYFTPEELRVRADLKYTFVDGGITPYNDPAFLLFRTVTAPQFGLGWPADERQLMLVSVGTGMAPRIDLAFDHAGRNLLSNAAHVPGALMNGAAADQDINCRHVGRCAFGAAIDSELGDMIPRHGDPLTGTPVPLAQDCGRAFLYARYDPILTPQGLADIGLGDVRPSVVRGMDAVAKLPLMQEVGRAYAERYVDMELFRHFC
jgi:hypothetical protein